MVIQVYNSTNFVELNKISAPDIEDPWSLATCRHYNCLYVSDAHLNHIHLVGLLDSAVTQECWSAGENVTMGRHRPIQKCSLCNDKFFKVN